MFLRRDLMRSKYRWWLPIWVLLIGLTGDVAATDYFLTISGGYAPSGNQASLEANVVFYQQVLQEQHRRTRQHEIFFADGHDPNPDLQILATKPQAQDRPATDLLASLHRRRGQERVEYRNHRVPNVSGPLDPMLIRTHLGAIAKQARAGDRVIIYVTAHGSPGPEDDPFNTTIDCWNERKITAREFSRWLKELPPEVSTLMIMAQCYCGGFSRTIFADLDESNGLSPQVRAGFFAQQYNLPAAGCRPDIQNDEEFSSYFWGALVGRTRKGTPIEGSDVDGDGLVSFAEAYAYAVTSGETIDIPLRTSDVLLRTYSRMPDVDAKSFSNNENDASADAKQPANASSVVLSTMAGTIQSFVDRGRPIPARIITELARGLGFKPDDNVSVVLKAYDDHLDVGRGPGRGRPRGGRGSGRRDLLREVSEKWPELGDERRWESSPLLNPENQEQLLTELKQLPSWKVFDERRQQIEGAGDQSERHELREVKFRRLIKALELVALEKNLPLVATPEVIDRFQQMIALEESTLNSPIAHPVAPR